MGRDNFRSVEEKTTRKFYNQSETSSFGACFVCTCIISATSEAQAAIDTPGLNKINTKKMLVVDVCNRGLKYVW